MTDIDLVHQRNACILLLWYFPVPNTVVPHSVVFAAFQAHVGQEQLLVARTTPPCPRALAEITLK